MKRISIITLFLTLLLLIACKEEYNLYPAGYDRMLSIKNSGVRELHLGNIAPSYEDLIYVLKGGGNPDGDAAGWIEPMTLEQACKEFGCDPNQVEIIDKSNYSIPNGSVAIAGKAHSQAVSVVLSPVNIYRQSLRSPEKTMILPLVLKSVTDNITASGSMLLYRFDVNGPVVVWPDAADITAEITYRSLDYSLTATVERSESSVTPFVGKLATTGLQTLVDAYNSKHSTSYSLLPASSWTFDGFNVPAKTENVSGALHLSRSGLTTDRTYLLPLKFDGSSYPVGISGEVRYLIVTNPKYCYRTIDRTNWQLKFVNSQEDWYGGSLDLQWFAPYAFDGRPSTSWGTNWDTPDPSTYANGDDYDYNPDSYLHSFVPTVFKGTREVPNILMVIDLGQEYNLGGAGILQSVQENERKIQKCEVYAASSFTFKTYQAGGSVANYNTLNDGNSWTLLTTVDLGRDNKEYWSTLPSAVKGRYVKIRPIQLFDGNTKAVNLAEFYVKELVSVDGNPPELRSWSQQDAASSISLTNPNMTLYMPARSSFTGKCVVVIPGGGYSFLAGSNEGEGWASYYNNLGIACAVLRYTLPGGNPALPITDAENAIKYLRNASALNIHSVGVHGFSAGGHLASTIATHFTSATRPDFQILFYPVITMGDGTHIGSRNNFLGTSPTNEMVMLYSNQLQVTASTPKAFVMYYDNDPTVNSSANGAAYVPALTAKGVSVTSKVFSGSIHGWNDTDKVGGKTVRGHLTDWLNTL